MPARERGSDYGRIKAFSNDLKNFINTPFSDGAHFKRCCFRAALYNGDWFRYTKDIRLIYRKERLDMVKKTTLITVQNVPVTVMHVDQRDYISLTDMAKARTDAARAAM